ncbi:MAG: hypothetical protein H7336_00200 [Bacteriovorax sp.]|nr:hypothetical protein [Bacteriovorax sp.]
MNFQKLMLSTLIVVTSVSTSLHAQDSIGWGPGSRPGNQNQPRDPRDQSRDQQAQEQRDPWGNDRDDSSDVELQVNSYFQNQARLDLIRDSYIRSQLQGKLIQSVVITASTQDGNGQARLLVNGQSADQGQRVARQMMQYTFRVDPFSNSVSQNLRNLELDMRGSFYVEKVVFNVLQNSGPTWPGPGTPTQPSQADVVRQQVNQSIQGEGGLQLYRLFSLGTDRQGQALRRVSVRAHALRGFSQVSLIKNAEQSASMQSIGGASALISIEVGGLRIGQDIRDLRLYFRGDVVVEEVSLEFDRAGNIPGPGPILENRIEQIVNQRLYETSGVALKQLLRIDPRQNNRIVNSVEITMRGSDYGTRLSLCQLVQGQLNMNCGAQQIMQPGVQRIILSSVNFARLSELNLSVRMGMIDIERIVINLR